MFQIDPKRAWEELSDGEVWHAFKGGDKAALGFIYHSNVQSLFNYGMKIHFDSEFVQDCIQELFLELWNQRNKLSETDHIHFYLIKAIRWKILRQLEYHKRYDRRINEYHNEHNEALELPFETLIINERIDEEKKAKLHEAIKKLPVRQREIIQLFFFDKYSYEEISEIMSMHLRSVYTLSWKAVSSLRKVFSKHL